jgi:hypothetical protein
MTRSLATGKYCSRRCERACFEHGAQDASPVEVPAESARVGRASFLATESQLGCAALASAYRLDHGNTDGLRLMLLDEAFNKMDMGNIVATMRTARLDMPYVGLPATTIRRAVSRPSLVMTIENQTTFHSEARRRCQEPVLLIFTAGMPSPVWRAMYGRLLQDMPVDVPLYHWGDIDEGGLRIAARLAQDAQTIGRAIEPWRMHPNDVPVEDRRPATAGTLARMQPHAELAGWTDLGQALLEAGFTIEQEGLKYT